MLYHTGRHTSQLLCNSGASCYTTQGATVPSCFVTQGPVVIPHRAPQFPAALPFRGELLYHTGRHSSQLLCNSGASCYIYHTGRLSIQLLCLSGASCYTTQGAIVPSCFVTQGPVVIPHRAPQFPAALPFRGELLYHTGRHSSQLLCLSGGSCYTTPGATVPSCFAA